MALLTTEDVLNKKFQYVKFREGYDQDEVDEFLDEVVSTIYSLQMENQELKEKLEAAERRVAELSNGDFTPVETPAPAVVETPAPVMPTFTGPQDPESATSMLALAQRVRRVRARWRGAEREDHRRGQGRARVDHRRCSEAEGQRPQAARAGA